MHSTHSDLNSWTWNDYHKYVKGYLDTFPGNISTGALALYPDGVESAAYQYTTLTSDLRVVCPNNIMADILTKYFMSPVYRYVLTQWRPIPSIFSATRFYHIMRATHGIPMRFLVQ